MSNPTIVSASLDDNELKQSIANLVAHVKRGLHTMLTDTNSTVDEMERKLKSLGNLKIDSGGAADGGASKRTSSLKQEEQQVKSVTTSYDGLANQLQKIKEINSSKNAKAVYESISAMPNNTIEQVNLKLQALQTLKEKVANTPLLSKSSQSQLTRAITDAKSRIEQLENSVRGTNQSKKSLDELNAAVAQSIRKEEERRNAIYQTGIAAQESFAKIRQSVQTQLIDNTDKPIMGFKELTEAIRNMERAYWGMDSVNRESPLGQSLKRDIENAQKLKIAIDAYNRELTGMSVLSTKNNTNRSLGAYTELTNILKNLSDEYKRLGREERNAAKGNVLADKIQRLSRETQKIQQQMNRPISFSAAMKGDEKTLDDIAYKMQRLRSYKQGIDLTKPNAANDIKQVDEALSKLQKDADKWMGKTQAMINSNNALGRSWNYMKNRLAFYFTVGASTSFIKNLIEVRSQYEMNERALGILINSAERGTQIFNELSQMALVSPYTLIELSAAAKQLTAYDIAAKDVVDTTRRLADMASAVGIPIERLTYALGQIKAYGYLNSRDARMFANAGIPLVKQLSDYYTELEGKMVSTADVYDRMKKKAIDYNSVMSVVTKMTDEGGKFFDFQAKMADTLKVRLANLTLAWNNMLNDMGKESQGVLTWGIGALRQLFLHWKQLDALIKDAAWILGIRTGFMLIVYAALKVGGALGITTRQMALSAVVGKRLAGVLRTLGQSLATIAKSRITWLSLLALAAWDIFDAFVNANKATEDFNKSLRDNAKTTYDDLKKFAEQYKNVRDSLYTTQKTAIGNIYDPSTGKATATAYANQTVGQDISASEAKKAWEAMREQIELSSHASDEYISKLLSIENVSERLRQGFKILDDIQTVSAALKDIGDDGIKVTQGWSAWWNAWQGADGLIQNIKDLQKELQRLKDTGSDHDDKFVKVIDKDYHTALERFRKDLKVTTDSVIDFINLNGWSGDTGKIDEVFKQVTDKLVTQGNLDPQTAFTLQREVEVARSKAAKEALEIRIADEKKALATASDEISKQQIQKNLETLEQQKRDFDKFNGENRAYWNDFTKYIKERHISELTAAYNSMTDHGKKAMDFQSEEWQKRVHDWANRYEKSHNLATDSVFNRLRNWINDANTWSVFIKMTISNEDGKSVYKQLEEYDKAADDAWKTMQRLDKRISQLRKKGAKEVEGAETGRADFSRVSADDKELTEALKERTQAQKEYNDAIAKGGESKKENTATSKAQRQAESELEKTLKEELSTIEKVRSAYKELIKAGASHADAIKSATEGWEETMNAINKVLNKNGLKALNLSDFVGIEDPDDIVSKLQSQLDAMVKRGAKTAEIQVLQAEIKKLKVDAKKYDLTNIMEGLSRELDKLKDKYELAIELEANPELGDMFVKMFGIDSSTLPRSFGEAVELAQNIINRELSKLNISTPFDLMADDIDEFAKSSGLNKESDIIKELIKWQNTYRDMFKKNLVDSEKMLDEYVKKYGDYSDKIAEIEADKLERIKKLNDVYYTEEMRKRPEYAAKMNAIVTGADREESNVKFDAFKNSRYYTMMFENLDYVSTKALRSMRDRIRGLMDTMNELKPEQLKQIMSQFEKIEEKLVSRNPFKNLAKDVNRYFRETKDRKAANAAFESAQKEYDKQMDIVSALKKKHEQAKANINTSRSYLDFLDIEIKSENEILRILEEQVAEAEKKADKYNLTAKLAKSEVTAAVEAVAANMSSLGELRDKVNDLFGVDSSKGETLLGHKLDGYIDGMTKAGEGLSKVVSSLQSGNVVGAASGVIDVIAGRIDAISSIFGGGAAKTRRINREIAKSKDTVSQLSMAYEDLERAVQKSLGTAETEARRAAIANKEMQLAELERQMTLEKSKRSKDRDDDAIKQYEETIHSLRNEIEDLKDDVVNNLFGEDVKSAAEAFVDAWVQAWRAGETTIDAMKEKMDEMVYNLVKKAMTSKIVEGLLNPIYNELDRMTKEGSEGGVGLTASELRQLAQQAGVTAEQINTALGEFYGNLANLGIISPTEESRELSALQQGIQGITEDTAGALEAYMNGVSQQCYLQSDLLTQIRDAIVGFETDIQLDILSGILLQLQSSYQTQQAIQSILEGWSSPDGLSVRVEMK